MREEVQGDEIHEIHVRVSELETGIFVWTFRTACRGVWNPDVLWIVEPTRIIYE